VERERAGGAPRAVGKVRPSSLAVLRLRISSIFVASAALAEGGGAAST